MRLQLARPLQLLTFDQDGAPVRLPSSGVVHVRPTSLFIQVRDADFGLLLLDAGSGVALGVSLERWPPPCFRSLSDDCLSTCNYTPMDDAWYQM